jgi:hypothetical protein
MTNNGDGMSTLEKEYLKSVIWFNLLVGIQNIWFYTNNDSMFNLVIGCINIGVWVFNRSILWPKERKRS